MKDPVRLDKFKGINNLKSKENLDPNELTEAVNTDINNGHGLSRRVGATLFSSGAADSLYSDGEIALLRRSDALQQLNADGTVTSLLSGMTLPIRYCKARDRIYFSDSLVNGIFHESAVSDWGITPPTTQPTYTEIAGSMPEGLYQYAVTFINADGEESGTGLTNVADVSAGGLSFANIPISSQSGVTHKALYLTRQNGVELYQAMILPNATTTATFTDDVETLTVNLETQFLQPPPPSNCIAEHNGRLLIGVGRFLMYSKAYRYDLFDPINMSYEFESAVKEIIPVQGGVFVGTEKKITFMTGDDITNVSQDIKAEYGVVPGTVDYTDSSNFNPEHDVGIVAIFAAQKGLCIAGDGGAFKNLTIDRYSFPESITGAGKVIIENDKNRYVSVLRR